MADERQFMQLLREITEIARANDNFITTEDINDYFEEMDLNDTQKEAIYDYLCKGHITVKGYMGLDKDDAGADSVKNNPSTKVEEFENGTVKPKMNTQKSGTDSDYSQTDMPSARTSEYRKKVRELGNGREVDIEEIHVRLTENGDDVVIEEAIHAYLPVVVNMASRYANRGVHVDELIQEGNLALIMAIRELAGNPDGSADSDNTDRIRIVDFEKHIRNRIRESMIGCIDAELEVESGLAAAMGKASLVYEASKQLAESMGKVATLRELSEFTHIPEDEIEDIVKFSGYAIKYSK